MNTRFCDVSSLGAFKSIAKKYVYSMFVLVGTSRSDTLKRRASLAWNNVHGCSGLAYGLLISRHLTPMF